MSHFVPAHFRGWILALGLTLGSYPALAASLPPDSLRLPSRRLGEVGVDAPTLSKRLFSSTGQQSLSMKDMETRGIRNLADALQRFAGTQVKDYGGIGGMKTISVRNMGAAHTAVSYDGLPVSNCQAGQVDIGRFAIEALEDITLYNGQADNLLQPARLTASGAVLSLQAPRPTFDGGTQKYQLTAQCKAGSFGEVNPSLRYAHRTGQKGSVHAYANFMRADGVYPFELRNVLQVSRERRHNSDIRQGHGEIGWQQTLRDSSKLDIKAYGFLSERGLPGAVVLYVDDARERLCNRNAFAQAVWNKRFSTRWQLQAAAKYTYGWERYRDFGASYMNGMLTERTTQQEGYATAAAVFRPNRHWQFSLAEDGALNTLESNSLDVAQPTRYTNQAAVTGRFESRRVSLTGTLVHTYVTEHAAKGKLPDDLSHLSPSLSLSVRPFARLPLRLRAMYRNTYRVPTFNELYYRRLGFTALKPENADQLSCGLTAYMPPKGICRQLSLTADGYYNRVRDKIVAIPTAYVWRMQNFGRVRMYGMDVTGQLSLQYGKAGLDLSTTYTWQNAHDLTDKESQNYKHQLPYTPAHSGNVSATLRTPWVDINYSVMAVGVRYFHQLNLKAYRMDGYEDHSLTAGHTFTLPRCRMTLYASLLNLTDAQYAVVKNYPMPGRAYRFTAKLEL